MEIRSAYRTAWLRCYGYLPTHELSEDDVAVIETIVEIMKRPKRRAKPNEAVAFLGALVSVLWLVYCLALAFGWVKL